MGVFLQKALRRVQQFINQSISNKITFTFSAMFFIVFLCAFCAIYGVISQVFTQRLVTDTQVLLEKVKDNIDYHYNELKNSVVLVANDNSAKQLIVLSKENPQYYQSLLKYRRNLFEMINHMTALKPYIKSVSIWNEDGCVLSTSNMDVDHNFYEEFNIKDTSAIPSILYCSPHTADYYKTTEDRENAQMLSCIYKITLNNRVIGCVLCDMDKKTLDTILQDLAIIPDNNVYLLDASGNIIYQKGSAPHALSNDEIKSFLVNESSYLISNQNLIVYNTLDSNGWKLIMTAPYKEVVKPTGHILKISIVAVMIGISLTILFSVLISKNIKKPLDELLVRFHQIEENNFSVKAYNKENQYAEIIILREKFEEMVHQIDCLINKVYIAEIRRKESELESLKNQVNPHFLFNILQMFQAEAMMDGNRLLEEMIMDLSYLMHYMMGQKEKQVTIQQECEYIKCYLDLYHKRYENNLEYCLELDKNIAGKPIMKFILQPLVENCIKHGFKSVERKWSIQVSIRQEEDKVIFMVQDNGCGITPEKLDQIKKHIQDDTELHSIGLRNLYQRLKLTYGDRSRLLIKSKYGEFTCVICEIYI